MRRDDLYLNDIVEAADHIAAFLGQTDFESFRQSELVRSAVVQKLVLLPRVEKDSWTFALEMKSDQPIEVFELKNPVRIILDIRLRR